MTHLYSLTSMLTATQPTIIFFFQRHRHHRDLHSFPTRRSSDLQKRRDEGDRIRTGGLAAGGQPRSEEHTSELQSHSDLVCRLLLEKKKKKNIKHQQEGDCNSYKSKRGPPD